MIFETQKRVIPDALILNISILLYKKIFYLKNSGNSRKISRKNEEKKQCYL